MVLWLERRADVWQPGFESLGPAVDKRCRKQTVLLSRKLKCSLASKAVNMNEFVKIREINRKECRERHQRFRIHNSPLIQSRITFVQCADGAKFQK